MTSDRKKPGVALWVAVMVAVLLIGYPLSFGPACWINCRLQPSGEFVSALYRPLIGEMEDHRPRLTATPLRWWCTLGLPDTKVAVLTVRGIRFMSTQDVR
jgi:hypothetical protein